MKYNPIATYESMFDFIGFDPSGNGMEKNHIYNVSSNGLGTALNMVC